MERSVGGSWAVYDSRMSLFSSPSVRCQPLHCKVSVSQLSHKISTYQSSIA